ncbi:NAD(P)-binding protein [Leptothermofonsia sichuanensis E412]|uniref:protoporphyrinogen/coproporphyrinogen oxidase n=1 Tax=Leptothermofonsia sichuanensis TaxID=2917832 RepID=UPI001CA649F8|nr:FAD-dependent oxidoreductase [Leptothermofonsia sichuanensis]QZZ22110.1 NAD(P)-binding protein [Leptothermofonsia sichuanensis E412]
MKVVVLGSGMAGFGAVHRLHSEGIQSCTYDQHPYYGGHTASHTSANGFTFDEGPHVSFTKIERLQKLLAENVNHQYETLKTYINNYWKGYWIKHPAQCNLYGLPTDLVVDILRDFIHAQNNDYGEINNYEDWLKASFGKTFAETFPMEYTLKYWTTSASNMSTEWVGPRLYQPKLEEVLRGALAPPPPDAEDIHYVTHFRYPSRGGFVSYLAPFAKQTDLRLGHELVKFDPNSRELHFANGVVDTCDHLISSIPLPELIPMISGTPTDVLEAAQLLACTSVVLVNLGVNRADLIDANWTYFYDRDIIFPRISTPHLQSPNNVPPGTGSIQVEVYFSKKYRPLDRLPEDYIQPVINDLQRCGILREDDEILFRNAMLVPYANVIFDLDRAKALSIVHGYLDDIGVNYCGRFGDWGYLWTDDSFISGENAAQKVLDSPK